MLDEIVIIFYNCNSTIIVASQVYTDLSTCWAVIWILYEHFDSSEVL